MTEPIVSFERLSFAYRPRKWIFRDYSAAITKGSVFALLGPNGRGKTTLLKLLLGALKPSEGGVAINSSIAFVPQLFHVSFDYTALDMVLMGRARMSDCSRSRPRPTKRRRSPRSIGSASPISRIGLSTKCPAGSANS